MAVEAQHNMYNLFHSSNQFVLANRDLIKFNHETGNTIDHVIHSNHETLSQIHLNHQYPNIVGEAMDKQYDSGLTHNAAPRKRQRDPAFHQETTTMISNDNVELLAASNNSRKLSKCSLIDKDIAFQIQQNQTAIDIFVAEHTEKVRMELENQRKREAIMVVRAFEEGIAKRLKEKDDEIIRMGKLNLALQERVKTLCVENQLWKDLAQSNEATAMSLRTNLEQALLAHVSAAAAADEENDAESCCGSTDSGRDDGGARTCRGCGEEEATVLVLPCRHLCLCSPCGSHLRACPVCYSLMTASVRVNFS